MTQNRQAVAVGDPLGLLQHVELLLGGRDYAADIRDHDAELVKLRSLMNEVEVETER